MTNSHYKFLALLPLFSILTMSPTELQSKMSSRKIASIIEIDSFSATPRYDARAAKLDKSKFFVDENIELSCFGEKAEALRLKIDQEKKLEKHGKKVLSDMVFSLAELDEDLKVLQKNKSFAQTKDVDSEKFASSIAINSLNKLKASVEELLEDEIKTDFLASEQLEKKESETVVAKEEVKPEKKEEPKEQKSDLCELEERNNVLTKQVADLMAQQSQILQNMMVMGNNMALALANQSSQNQIPSWMLSGSQNPYPYLPQIQMPIIIGQPSQSQDTLGTILPNQQNQQNQMGQLAYQQNLQSNQYQMPSYMQYDARYAQPQLVMPGSFGNNPFMQNFGNTQFNDTQVFKPFSFEPMTYPNPTV